MYWHVPTRLRGPVSRSRRNWKFPPATASPVKRGATRRLASAMPEIRRSLVARVRSEIESGRYDTPDRWEAALERLISRMESD